MSVRSAEQLRAWAEACRSLDIEPEPRTRPSPLRWLAYAFWLPLPSSQTVWILFDATCRTWVLRHVGRLLVVATLPTAAVILLFPGPLPVRLLTAVAAASGGLLFSGIWVNEATDHRLMRAGWRDGIGPELRQRRARVASWMATVRRL